MKPKVDLLFIFDVTSSMSGMIEDAKKRMRSILKDLSTKYDIDLKVGLSIYRDHPPQDNSFVTAVMDLSGIDQIISEINTITVNGGGDFPEAVIDGIIDGVSGMSWRKGSKRVSILIGDAVPHGMYRSDDVCCLCGKTWGDAISIMQKYNVIMYAIQMDNDKDTYRSFKTLSSFTGGIMINSEDAMGAVLSVLSQKFYDISIGSKVLELLSKGKTKKEISSMLSIDRDLVDSVF